MKITKLTKGETYDAPKMLKLVAGWTPGVDDSYEAKHYFDYWGVYKGPDEYGVEPLFYDLSTAPTEIEIDGVTVHFDWPDWRASWTQRDDDPDLQRGPCDRDVFEIDGIEFEFGTWEYSDDAPCYCSTDVS